MSSFYGGREGRSFVITRNFSSVKEMVEKFQQGPSYNEVHFDEYVLINTVNKANPENGQVFRRGYDYNSERQIDTYNVKTENNETEITFAIEKIPAGGAIYIGTIVGPAGRAPVLRLAKMDDVKALGDIATLDVSEWTGNQQRPQTIEDMLRLIKDITKDEDGIEREIPVDSLGNVILDGKEPFAYRNYVKIINLNSLNEKANYYFYYDKILYGKDSEASIGWYMIDTPLVIPENKYSVDDGHLIPGVSYAEDLDIDDTGRVHKIPNGYQDTIDWAYCSIRNENNEDTIAYIGFKFPYTVFEYEAESVDAYYNRSDLLGGKEVETNNFNHLNLVEEIETGHPFYSKWNFKIPKGIKGESIKNVRVITANTNVVAFDVDNNGNLQYNESDGHILTKDYDGKEDDVANDRKIIVYDYYCYDRLPEGEHHIIYLGDFNKIDEIKFDDNGTITLDYSHDDTVIYPKLIDWITDMSFEKDGTVIVKFNNDTILNGQLTKENLITWMTKFDLDADTGSLEIEFNNNSLIQNISKTLQWVKEISIADDGTITTDYTNIANKVENQKLNWIKSCSLDSETGTLNITFNNDNINSISHILNYIKKVERDQYNHLLITHSDPDKGVQDLGGIGYMMVASENDTDLVNKQNTLSTGGVWFITKEV